MASEPISAARPLLTLLWLGATLLGQGQTTSPPSPQAPTRPVAATVSRSKAEAAAAQVDRLLQAGLTRRGEQPTAIVDDATFARRAWLQVVGRVPSLDEIEAFLADQSADKRAALVDRLLDSPGYTSNEANFWFDLLRVKSRQRQLSGEPFAHWIREQIRQGTPYDRFVAAMLTASGPAAAEGNGATGYLLRDMNMPHDAMANTLRLFLGTRVECAQCHNHPTDKWTQRDFYATAAFFGGLRYRVDVDRELTQQLRQLVGSGDDRQKQAARRVLQTFAAGLAGSGSGQERLPADYKYDDAKPRDVVAADTPFGTDVRLPRPTAPAEAARGRQRQRAATPTEVDSRQAFAGWLTSPRNPRFARVITNRLWQRTFGRGLIEPVDDLKDTTVAVHPELQQHLEKLLVDLDFDLRQFERVLLLTRLFQQQVAATDPPSDAAYAFAAPLLRRMTAEQLWDSVLTLSYPDLDARLQPTDARAKETYRRHAEIASSSPEQLAELLARPPQRIGPAVQQGQQRLQELAEQLRSRPVAEQQEVRRLQRELAAARRGGDAAALERIGDRLAELGLPRPEDRAARARTGELLRASDLPQPSARDHWLGQFGQSDRETIDGASLAATVPQALTLMNGLVADVESNLRRRLAGATDAATKIRLAHLAILSREPTEPETQRWLAVLADDPTRGTQDLVWVLVNCNEFRFRR